MINRNVFATRLFSVLFVAAILSVLPATNLFGQSDSQKSGSSFATLASISEKYEISALARPRLVAEIRTPHKVDDRTKIEKAADSFSIKPNTILVNSTPFSIQLDRRAFEILNQKRTENGLSPLVWSEEMAKIARQHSNNMANLKFFSHAGLDGLMVSDRADALGISNWKAIGENIAYNRGYNDPAEFACERWMLSTSHRENILNRRWKEAAIGVGIASDGTYYFTEVFVLR